MNSPFLNTEPVARSSDPVTAHLAAAQMKTTRRTQKRRVLLALREFPNVTSAELSMLADLPRYMVARRLPDLQSEGLVEATSQRTCQVSDRMALIWATTFSGRGIK